MATKKELVYQKRTLLRSTSLVSMMTFFSRLMGFARDMILASFFGAQAGMDAFYLAFRIPNFMRRLFAEGAFSQAFVPVLAEYQEKQDIDTVRLFISQVFGHLAFILGIVTLLAMIAAPLITLIFAPGFGFEGTRAILATEMLRITFPYLLFISLTAMAGAVLNTYGYFAIPAFTPVLLNLSLIVAALYVAPLCAVPVKALAYGVFVAGLVQLLFQLPSLARHHLLVRPRLALGDPGVHRVVTLMIPALFGVSVAQLNLMIDSIFASFLKVGSISWLFYTDRLTDFPLGVFGVAIATVILPHLSRRNADEDNVTFSISLDWALRLILLVGTAAATGLVFFSMPLIASCFGYGVFHMYDVIQTQKSLIALGLGVPAFMSIKVLASGFYAKQNIKTPVKIGVWAMFANSILCAILVWPLAHAGLALASALAGYLNMGFLLYRLIQQKHYTPVVGWRKYILQLLFANTALAVYLLWCAGSVEYWTGLHAGTRLGYLLLYVTGGIGIYIGALYSVGIRIQQFRGKMRERG